MSALLTYALNEQGELVHVDSVLKGSACKCVCPNCKKPLDAKNGGEIREHHFAHSHGYECVGAFETAMHLLAKKIMMEEKSVMLPMSTKEDRPYGLVHFVDVREEHGYNESNYRPDIEAVLENGEVIQIEFYVSHKVNGNKLRSIKENRLNCIEIDLNYVTLNREEMKDFLLNNNSHRVWLTDIEAKKNSGDGLGLSYKRNSLQLKAVEYIKDLFEKEELSLCYNNNIHNLSDWGYDVCELLYGSTHHMIPRGIHADLLLYRSNHEQDGRIAICIRGRQRNFDFEYPKNIRVIDVIVREERDLDYILKTKGISQQSDKVIFNGFVNKPAPSEQTYRYYNYVNYIFENDV